MVSPGGTGIDVLLFRQKALNAAKRQIPGQSRAGSAATDDQYLGFHFFIHLDPTTVAAAGDRPLEQNVFT
jgi:hypothetical protein